MMGAARVGKTSIIKQFLYDQFPDRYKETIEELHRGEWRSLMKSIRHPATGSMVKKILIDIVHSNILSK